MSNLTAAEKKIPSVDRGPFICHVDDKGFTVICRTDMPAEKLLLSWRMPEETTLRQNAEISRSGGVDHVFKATGDFSGKMPVDLQIIRECDGKVLGNAASPSATAVPYLFNPGSESISVGWKSSAECAGAVEYRLAGSSRIMRKNALFTGNPATGISHIVHLDGLLPQTAYEYRVLALNPVNGKAYGYSSWYSFTTLKRNSGGCRMVFFSDIHADMDTFKKLSAVLAPEKADFAVLAGDLCWDGVYETDGKPFFEDFLNFSNAAFASGVPTVFMRGNHEWAGKYSFEWAKWFPGCNGKTYGAFRAGECCFVVLDTGPIGNYQPGTPAGDYIAEQKEWLEKTVMQSAMFTTARYRIVLAHMPTHGIPNAPLLEKSFAELFNRGKVQLMIVGHVHRYMRINRNDNGCYGTDYYTIWDESNPPRSALDKNYTLVINGGGPDENGIFATALELCASADNITVKAVKKDGSTVDEFRVLPDGKVENISPTKRFNFRGKYKK